MSKKNCLSLSLFAFLIVFALSPAPDLAPAADAQSRSTQERPLTTKVETSQDAQAKKVLDDSVLKVKEMLFPKVAPPSGAKTAGGCCNPYDTRNSNGVASIDIVSPNNYSKNKDYPTDGPVQAVYSPMNCWVISSYWRGVSSANPPYYAFDDAQPANFNYLTSTEFNSVLNEMKTYVGGLNIANQYKADFNLKLQQFVSNYGMYKNAIQTSHGQARHTARVKGRGWPNGTSRYHGHLNVTEICCPPEVRDSGELKKTLKAWVDQTASKLRVVTSVDKDNIKTN